MENLVGRTLKRYRVLNLLGEGGMGAVYQGHDLTLQRDVAIKVMHPHFARRPDFQERFLQEARTAARLDHPGIVQVYDFGHERQGASGPILYIVMEFIPGDNLEAMLRDLRTQANWILLSEAVGIIRQLCLALDYAHRQGVLHRDIKPGNIMIEPEPSDGLPYRPVVTDLGLAKLAEGGIQTQDGASMGTPAYMSPEQALGHKTDARSDVYSLGVLLFELATGQRPFPASSISDAIKYHVNTEPPTPSSLLPEIPRSLEQVILKAMQKAPAERYSSAAEFADALVQVIPDATKVASVPATLQAAVSLFTQYQKSLVEMRGASIVAEFPEPSVTTADRIQILLPDKSSRVYIPQKASFMIGRDPVVDIVIDDTNASRQHARIEFDGREYRVTDLNSTNGTYLGNKRLIPGMPEIWLSENALRIGSTWLRLNRARIAGTVPMMAVAGIAANELYKTHLVTSAGDGRVGVYIDQRQIRVEPGSTSTLPIVLLNQGSTVDQFKVSVVGVPPEWISPPAQPIQMMPGDQQQVSIQIHPPKDPKSRAGDYPLTISVSSQNVPGEFADLRIDLSVTRFVQFSSELYPQQLRVGQTGQLRIKNLGNNQERYTLTWKDRGNELNFTPQRARLEIPSGRERAAEFIAQPKRRRLIGGAQTHSIAVEVNPESGTEQVHRGEVTSKTLVPVWVLPIALILCLFLVGGIGYISRNLLTQTNSATQTADAEETQLAMVIEGTSQALTATAEWLTGDDDSDGITNQDELALGTDPQKRDTDEDGLDDGDEVNRGSDPMIADSDGDGLKDGAEVAQGTDPLVVDTDNDGTPDNLDDQPLVTDTPIPTETPPEPPTDEPTQTATDTPLPTNTLEPSVTPTIPPTPTFTSTTQPLRVMYIFDTDSATANSFKSLLESDGIVVDTHSLKAIVPVTSLDLSGYNRIIIAADTGSGSSWDGSVSDINHINAANKTTIGLGNGGYAFFGKLGLEVGYPNAWSGGGGATGVYVVNASHAIWNTPNEINIPGDTIVPLYASNGGYVAIHYPSSIDGVVAIGRQSNDATHYTLIIQDSRYILWGYGAGPADMTNRGKKVFINTTRYTPFLIFKPIFQATLIPLLPSATP